MAVVVGKLSDTLQPSPHYEPHLPSTRDMQGSAAQNMQQGIPAVGKADAEDELIAMGYEIYSGPGPVQNRPRNERGPKQELERVISRPHIERGGPKQELDRISIQSDFFRGGEEDFSDKQVNQGRFGQEFR
eukprot:GFUD01033534.1.p1 GENE.GFUD01033534.1~~GFUD01033534.1.p1  ORF type:complete len:131 (+),score=41.73 GFUD01033534.1:2-394(+)